MDSLLLVGFVDAASSAVVTRRRLSVLGGWYFLVILLFFMFSFLSTKSMFFCLVKMALFLIFYSRSLIRIFDFGLQDTSARFEIFKQA
jgi:hypothetical protein